ncbi:organic hydroperoxide resistance protein [Lysobacter rhizosphaerae]
MNTSLETAIYTAHTHVTGGRNGLGRSSDGELDVTLSRPGSGEPGTNPEQLFGIAYSACFIGAIQLAATARKVQMPKDASIDTEVTLGKTAAGEYQLAVKLNVNLPGLDEALKRELVEAAHQTCPYSRMTRGHVEVELAVA